MLFRQFLQAGDLRVALELLCFFVGARFFLGLLATLALYRDARFGILLDAFAAFAFGCDPRFGFLFDPLALRGLLGGFA